LDKIRTKKTLLLAGAILASAALFIMPNSPTLWFAAGMLWIMDASINVSMEPFRAFVGDNLPKSNVPWDLPCKVFSLVLVLTLHQNYR
jgi:maltose/moltooligosaccharide transporter